MNIIIMYIFSEKFQSSNVSHVLCLCLLTDSEASNLQADGNSSETGSTEQMEIG